MLIFFIVSTAPDIPDNAIVSTLEQPNGQQFVVVFNKPDERNGPIRLGTVLRNGITEGHCNACNVCTPFDATQQKRIM